MKTRSGWLIVPMLAISIWSSGLLHLAAQPPEDPLAKFDRITDNVRFLTITITVDRPDRRYLVGEVGTVTFTMANNTALPLEIPDPTDPLSGEIYLNNHSPECLAPDISDDMYQKCKPHLMHGSHKPEVGVRSRILQPGGSVSLVVRTTDHVIPESSITRITGSGHFAGLEGTWELTHHLGGSLIIQTFAPILEKLVWATLNAVADGRSEQVPLIAVKDGTDLIICISEGTLLGQQDSLEVDSQGKMRDVGVRLVAPFHRIATTPRPVQGLTATVDALDRITVHADLGQGLVHSFVLDDKRQLVQTIVQTLPETVSTPAAPDGPASGVSGTLYKFSANGSTSSYGHAVQYMFNWGDGSSSGWTPPGVTGSFHAWSAPGNYTVTAQARCRTDTAVVSTVSAGTVITIGGESVSTPAVPTGQATGTVGRSSTFSAGGAASSLGHAVQYRFRFGDGSVSPWLPVGTTSASYTWVAAGTFQVTVEARCSEDTQVISASSAPLAVVVGSAP